MEDLKGHGGTMVLFRTLLKGLTKILWHSYASLMPFEWAGREIVCVWLRAGGDTHRTGSEPAVFPFTPTACLISSRLLGFFVCF